MTMPMTTGDWHVSTVDAPVAEHGEGAVWDARDERLLWVDLTAGLVCSLDLESARTVIASVGRHVGKAVPHEDGGLVLATREGFCRMTESGDISVIAAPLEHDPKVRMNDGGVDPVGRFFAGSMSYDASPRAGTLFMLDLDGCVQVAVTDVTISNGISWDRAGDRCFYVDSGQGAIDVFSYDCSSGHLTQRRRLITLPPGNGEPDGLCLDADDNLWVAIWDGWRIDKYASDGRLLLSVPLPVSRPTSCVFGGPKLDRMFVTTSALDFPRARLAREPLAGQLLSFDPKTVGVASPRCGVRSRGLETVPNSQAGLTRASE